MRNILLIMAGLFFGVFLAEVLVTAGNVSPFFRVLPAVEPQLGGPDHDIGYAYKPDRDVLWNVENKVQVHINAQAIRRDDNVPEKKDGEFRIALMGDSFAEALQVEWPATFAAQAERLLQQDAGNKTDIVNLAMGGSNGLRMLVRFERDLAVFRPDMGFMLLPDFKLYNGDLRNDSQSPAYMINGQGRVERSYGFRNRFSQRYADTIPGRVFVYMMHHSHLFRSAYYKAKDVRAALSDVPAPAAVTPVAGGVSSSAQASPACERETLRRSWDFWGGPASSDDRKVMDQFLADMRAAGDAIEKNAPMVLALRVPVPASSCADELALRHEIISRAAEITKSHGVIFMDWDADLVRAMSGGVSGDAGLAGLQGFGRHAGSGHLNYYGHKVWAGVLADALRPYVQAGVKSP